MVAGDRVVRFERGDEPVHQRIKAKFKRCQGRVYGQRPNEAGQVGSLPERHDRSDCHQENADDVERVRQPEAGRERCPCEPHQIGDPHEREPDRNQKRLCAPDNARQTVSDATATTTETPLLISGTGNRLGHTSSAMDTDVVRTRWTRTNGFHRRVAHLDHRALGSMSGSTMTLASGNAQKTDDMVA